MNTQTSRPGFLRGQDVFNWLHRLDLSHHFDKFLSSGYDDLSYCRRIGECDLQAIGITDIHERLALLQAIRILHVTSSATSTPTKSSHHHAQLLSQFQRGLPGQSSLTTAYHHQQREEIELQLLKNNKSRVLFYNNNNDYLLSQQQYSSGGHHEPSGPGGGGGKTTSVGVVGEADYSECAEYDLTRCYCEGGGGVCIHCNDIVSGINNGGRGRGCVTTIGSASDPEPFYESVLLPTDPRGGGGNGGRVPTQQRGNNMQIHNGFLNQQSDRENLVAGNQTGMSGGGMKSLKTHLRDQVIHDGINFSRIPDEMALRAVAAKYAMEFSSYSINNGGGASFSSTSTASSSSSGYPSSVATNSSSASSSNSNSTNSKDLKQQQQQPSFQPPAWIREGLPLLEFQQQVLQQLREIWLEERRKLLYNTVTSSANNSHRLNSGNIAPTSHHHQGINPSSRSFGFDSASSSSSTQNLIDGGGGGTSSSNPGGPNNSHHHLSLRSPSGKIMNGVGGGSGASSNFDTPKRLVRNFQFQSQQFLSYSSSVGGGDLGGRHAYTPGVYQPSSCLRDREDIYDYIPPKPKQESQEIDDDEDESNSPSPQYSVRPRGSTLTRFQSRGGRQPCNRDYAFVLSPKRGASSATSGSTMSKFSTLRGRVSSTNGVNGHPQPPTSLSSYTISGNCSSSSSVSNNSSNANQYGFASGVPHYPYPRMNGGDTVGCKTLVNLHKLGRRLGLSRFFRTLRIQNPDGSGCESRRHYFNKSSSSSDRVLYGITPTSAETLVRLRRMQAQTNNNPGFQDDQNSEMEPSLGESSLNKDYCTVTPRNGLLSSLPSNERIIETINRLKYEELQKRKERISHEHQMMLKELKGHVLHASSTATAATTAAGSSRATSTFYVDPSGTNATIATTGSEEYLVEESCRVETQESNPQTNYEEPFDSLPSQENGGGSETICSVQKTLQDGTTLTGGTATPGQRTSSASKASNESFSEIFARHLRSRMSSQSKNGSGANNGECGGNNNLSMREKVSHFFSLHPGSDRKRQISIAEDHSVNNNVV